MIDKKVETSVGPVSVAVDARPDVRLHKGQPLKWPASRSKKVIQIFDVQVVVEMLAVANVRGVRHRKVKGHEKVLRKVIAYGQVNSRCDAH